MTTITATSKRTKKGTTGKGKPANIPFHYFREHEYQPDDVVEIVGRACRPASARAAVPGVNVPAEGETWQELAAFRAAYGLPPVTR